MLRRESSAAVRPLPAAAPVSEHASGRAARPEAADPVAAATFATCDSDQPITLEVHEACAVDVGTMKMLRLVLDDLGHEAGLRRLRRRPGPLERAGRSPARLCEVRPQAHRRARHGRRQTACNWSNRWSRMCRQLGIVTLAEGIETAGEAEICRRIGFELMQGYHFGRPFAKPASVVELPKQPRSPATLPKSDLAAGHSFAGFCRNLVDSRSLAGIPFPSSVRRSGSAVRMLSIP